MNVWKPIALAAVVGLVGSLGTQIASAKGGSIGIDRHPNLSHASEDLGAAANHISSAQVANEFDMQGHAARAKELIGQARSEIEQARQAANGR